MQLTTIGALLLILGNFGLIWSAIRSNQSLARKIVWSLVILVLGPIGGAIFFLTTKLGKPYFVTYFIGLGFILIGIVLQVQFNTH
jgi:hypothetical protein